MLTLDGLARDWFPNATKLLAVGVTTPLHPPFENHARFPDPSDLCDGVLWEGPSEHAHEAARQAASRVRVGGRVVLVFETRATALSAVRALFSSHDAQRDHAEDLCGALLAAGLEEPELIVESPALIAVRGFVRARARTAF